MNFLVKIKVQLLAYVLKIIKIEFLMLKDHI
jgi:hypothetical protein